jgi:hypothetical protein
LLAGCAGQVDGRAEYGGKLTRKWLTDRESKEEDQEKNKKMAFYC